MRPTEDPPPPAGTKYADIGRRWLTASTSWESLTGVGAPPYRTSNDSRDIGSPLYSGKQPDRGLGIVLQVFPATCHLTLRSEPGRCCKIHGGGIPVAARVHLEVTQGPPGGRQGQEH